jgi:N-acetylglucosaminyldiphosphoundecaprenol N-acetyl-beta-D-mannosaminyltransferase
MGPSAATVRDVGHTCGPRRPGPIVNGVRIDPITRSQLVQTVDEYLRCGKAHVVHFCAAHPTVAARGDPAYRALLNAGDLNVADGLPVAWAARLHGARVERLAGTESMHQIMRWGIPRDLSHYFYGGTTDTIVRLRERIETEHPGTRIAGMESPPFRPLSSDEVEEDAARIARAGTQALWIGLGAPKQDLAAERFRELQAAPVILCVGAAFDFAARTKRRAPAWMRQVGLEWFHRLASEPRRLWRRYLVGNPQFVAGVVLDLIRDPSRPHR